MQMQLQLKTSPVSQQALATAPEPHQQRILWQHIWLTSKIGSVGPNLASTNSTGVDQF